MISDEPDEDADNLGDEAVLGTVIGHDPPNLGSSPENFTLVSDWPSLKVKDAGLELDHSTLAWFQANHADWREEIGFVLQAWVTMQIQARI